VRPNFRRARPLQSLNSFAKLQTKATASPSVRPTVKRLSAAGEGGSKHNSHYPQAVFDRNTKKSKTFQQKQKISNNINTLNRAKQQQKPPNQIKTHRLRRKSTQNRTESTLSSLST
jgi:hypothetical protein